MSVVNLCPGHTRSDLGSGWLWRAESGASPRSYRTKLVSYAAGLSTLHHVGGRLTIVRYFPARSRTFWLDAHLWLHQCCIHEMSQMVLLRGPLMCSNRLASNLRFLNILQHEVYAVFFPQALRSCFAMILKARLRRHSTLLTERNQLQFSSIQHLSTGTTTAKGPPSHHFAQPGHSSQDSNESRAAPNYACIPLAPTRCRPAII